MKGIHLALERHQIWHQVSLLWEGIPDMGCLTPEGRWTWRTTEDYHKVGQARVGGGCPWGSQIPNHLRAGFKALWIAPGNGLATSVVVWELAKYVPYSWSHCSRCISYQRYVFDKSSKADPCTKRCNSLIWRVTIDITTVEGALSRWRHRWQCWMSQHPQTAKQKILSQAVQPLSRTGWALPPWLQATKRMFVLSGLNVEFWSSSSPLLFPDMDSTSVWSCLNLTETWSGVGSHQLIDNTLFQIHGPFDQSIAIDSQLYFSRSNKCKDGFFHPYSASSFTLWTVFSMSTEANLCMGMIHDSSEIKRILSIHSMGHCI